MNEENIYKALSSLRKTGRATLYCNGGSMRPIIPIGSKVTYEVASDYEVDDIVLCKIGEKYIHAHKIKEKMGGEFLVGNNLGKTDGWTDEIYAKVVEIQRPEENEE